MTRYEYEMSVERLCDMYGIGPMDTAGSSRNNIRQYVKNAYDLIGKRVSVHTNRNAHIWSILGPNGATPVKAYALDCVLLKDVCWLPPSVAQGRRTFHKMQTQGKKERTVQAFAEGVLVAVDDMLVDSFRVQESVEVTYNPMNAEWVGAFRERRTKRPVASSEFGSLAYCESLSLFHGEGNRVRAGSRPVESLAYNDVQWIPSDYDTRYVQSILAKDSSKVKRLDKYISPACQIYQSDFD